MKSGAAPPAVGTVTEYDEAPLKRIREWAEEGDLVRATGAETDNNLLFHPDYVERVLFGHHDSLKKHMVGQTQVATKSVGSVYGEQWRAQRSAQQPTFAPERVRSYCQTFRTVAEQLVADLPPGKPVAIHPVMKQTALRMILATLAGAPPDQVDGRIVETSDAITEWHHAKTMDGEVPPAVQERFDTAHKTLLGRIDALIDEREPRSEDGDLIETLLAVDPDGEAGYTDERIRDEIVAKLFSAHRTTAQSWTYTLYHLAGSPDAEQKLLAELANVTDGDSPGPDHIDDLVYTEQAVQEALRLHPPAPILSRVLTTDLAAGDYTLAEGDIVSFPMVVIHRDERWWNEPDVFRPKRFEDEPRHSFAYVPFGLGPRRCIGESFAMAEAKVVVGNLLTEFSFERETDTVHLLPGSAGVLDPERPLQLTAHTRD